MLCIRWTAFCAALTLFASITHATTIYFARDLGAFPISQPQSLATDLNDTGAVVGTSRVDNANRAVLWPSGSSTLVDLSNLPNLLSASTSSINSIGQAVGSSVNGDRSRAFLWNPSVPNGSTGSITEITGLPGERNQGFAFDINDRGQVVGRSGNESFLWTPGTPNGATGTAVALGDLPGGSDASFATGMNGTGQVVGVSSTDIGDRGYLWTPATPNGSTGSMINLGALSPEQTSFASALNDRGEVVGSSKVTATSEHAVLWSANNGIQDLGDLAGGNESSRAQGINEHGVIVGYGTTLEGERAFVWTNQTSMIDLNRVLDPLSHSQWTLRFAAAVNESGQIVGWGTFDPDGLEGTPPAIHAFILSPQSVLDADWNLDGRVDEKDLLIWQQHSGEMDASFTDADADLDGDVDGNDLLVWQRSINASSVRLAVPEPKGFEFLSALLTVAVSRCGARYRKTCL